MSLHMSYRRPMKSIPDCLEKTIVNYGCLKDISKTFVVNYECIKDISKTFISN